jgi:hypothetical protein
MKMKKTNTKSDEAILWKNNGGNFYLAKDEDGTGLGKKIIHGRKFMAKPSQIPKAFRDNIRPVHDIDRDEMEDDDAEFTIVKSKKHEGLFNVKNTSTGKIINDKPLTKKAAKHIVEKMQGK